MPTCETNSAWTAVAITRDAYQKRIAAEHVAHEQWLANRCEQTKAVWNASRDAKAIAYRAYVRAVDAAIKSGQPWAG